MFLTSDITFQWIIFYETSCNIAAFESYISGKSLVRDVQQGQSSISDTCRAQKDEESGCIQWLNQWILELDFGAVALVMS